MPLTNNSRSNKIKKDIKSNLIDIPIARFVILIETGALIVLSLKYYNSNASDFVFLGISIGMAMIVSGAAGFVSDTLAKIRPTTGIDALIEKTRSDIGLITEDLSVVSNNIEKSVKRYLEDETKISFSGDYIECFLDADLFIKKGLVKIHSSRASALSSLDTKIKQINDQTDQNEVNIYVCGITLRDFFHENGAYYFQGWLKNTKNLKARVIILDKNSVSARERALRENPLPCSRGDEDNTLSNDLKLTEKNAGILLEKYPGKLNVKKTDAFPLCFLAVVNDTMIMEPYNYALRGGRVPTLEIKQIGDNDLYDVYMQHFTSLWIKPCQGHEPEKEHEIMEELSRYVGEYKSKSYADLPWEQSNQIEPCLNDTIVE